MNGVVAVPSSPFWADPSARLRAPADRLQPVAGGIAEMGGGVSPTGADGLDRIERPVAIRLHAPSFQPVGRALACSRSPRERRMFGKGAVICIWWNGSAANTTN